MRIHSDILTRDDFAAAARRAGVSLVQLAEHGSKTRVKAFSFYVSGSGVQGGQWGTQDYRTATWDEWGILLGHLFDVDAEAHCGKGSYLSADDYHWQTADRFRTLTPDRQHKRHKWEFKGISGEHGCKCGAGRRWDRWDYVRRDIPPSIAVHACAYRKLAGELSDGISDEAAAWAYSQILKSKVAA